MIIDLALIAAAIGAVISGYRRGFLQSLLSTIGYIGGGVAGLALALHFVENVHSTLNKFASIIVAIFLAAELGRRAFTWLGKYFHTKILWGPLRFIDSVAGVALELIRVGVIAFLIVSVILWSPWTSARKVVAESTLYPKISKQMPDVLSQLRTDLEKKLRVNLR
ncbi:unannotated protein [freshwater metagenome]|jgi:uncharacterized membrane protein required for colicin V production|uniref:Unannotated protein n=1 Tax=freshwater metagenome TaxID=449393 RepID=A0A6J7BJS1_9ZZZZ|nr:hypothetical protein [Actinomycetota bacterium]MSX62816.1 hypothetical protein [Actinomycetota bacterium]MTA67793.1 hypothetical protein [Actinomycetota bacterium]MTB16185.1 hypothetical protein [Actinomycetota bacterium]